MKLLTEVAQYYVKNEMEKAGVLSLQVCQPASLQSAYVVHRKCPTFCSCQEEWRKSTESKITWRQNVIVDNQWGAVFKIATRYVTEPKIDFK